MHNTYGVVWKALKSFLVNTLSHLTRLIWVLVWENRRFVTEWNDFVQRFICLIEM